MMRGDELISPLLQKDLDERVTDAGGDVKLVKQQMETELHELETAASESEQPQTLRRDIALVLAEIKYLDQKQEKTRQARVAEHPGLRTRMRHTLGMQG